MNTDTETWTRALLLDEPAMKAGDVLYARKAKQHGHWLRDPLVIDLRVVRVTKAGITVSGWPFARTRNFRIPHEKEGDATWDPNLRRWAFWYGPFTREIEMEVYPCRTDVDASYSPDGDGAATRAQLEARAARVLSQLPFHNLAALAEAMGVSTSK